MNDPLYSLKVIYQDVYGKIHQFTSFHKNQDKLITMGINIQQIISNAGQVFLYSLVEAVPETDFAPEIDHQPEITNH